MCENSISQSISITVVSSLTLYCSPNYYVDTSYLNTAAVQVYKSSKFETKLHASVNKKSKVPRLFYAIASSVVIAIITATAYSSA